MKIGAKAARIGALACCAVLEASVAVASTGFVFEDTNGNGKRDPGEPGLASVQVSNGIDVVTTDAAGAYRIADRPGALVFVIKPRGFKNPVDGANLPLFHAPAGADADFPLQRAEEPDDLRALILTDPQPSSPKEVDYLLRGQFERIGRRPDLAFGVTLGDVVYDRPDLFGAVNAVVAKVGIPWFNLPGNHDLALGTPEEAAAVAGFESVSAHPPMRSIPGPPSSSPSMTCAARRAPVCRRSNGGPVRVPIQPPSGHPRRRMGRANATHPAVPTRPFGNTRVRTADRLKLFSLLKDRAHVLVLSGRTHYQRHVVHGHDDG